MVRSQIPFAAVLALGLAGVGIARGGVEFVQLQASDLVNEIPRAKELGILPGDVLLGNEACRLVILAAPRTNDGAAVGRCIVLSPSRPDQPALVALTPGPHGVWQQAEAGQTARAAVVRFRAQAEQWSAEIDFQVEESVPWIEITTRLRNLDKDRTIEIPLVDEVELFGKAKVTTEKQEAIYIASENVGLTVAVIPEHQRAVVKEGAGDRRYVGFESGDPLAPLLKRMRSRVLPFGSGAATPLHPVAAERDWPRALKDRELWFRIEPGKERVIQRRLLTAAPKEIRSLVALAHHDSKPVTERTVAKLPSKATAPRTTSSQAKAPPPAAARLELAPPAAAARPPQWTTAAPTPEQAVVTGSRRPNGITNLPVTPAADVPRVLEASVAPPKPNVGTVLKPVEPARPAPAPKTVQDIQQLPPPIDQ